jgi:hypothetical protein
MTRNQAVKIVSRALALYLFVWALDNLSYLPGQLLSFSHRASLQSVFASDSYLRNYEFLTFGMTVVRVVALLAAAAWLYRCGPKVERYFSPEPMD